jgi:2-methylisocitrate lyase-like PEP mutase family enzyme
MIETLPQRLARAPAVHAPGVYDPLSALLVERAGFEAAYLSGASIAYTQIGRPDIGLVSHDHLADVTRRIRERTDLPLIVDADNGFGTALNVVRTVRLVEAAGASAIQIEDQTSPKRCGHLSGKSVIPAVEMVGKLRAALDARRSQNTLIIARTDAIAVFGLDEALDRADAFVECGADVVFVEAPATLDDMRTVVARLSSRVPLLANMVEGGSTPSLSRDELSEMGFRLVISPGALVRAYVHMAERFLTTLKEEGSTCSQRSAMLDLKQLNDRIGLTEIAALGARYDSDLAIAVPESGDAR